MILRASRLIFLTGAVILVSFLSGEVSASIPSPLNTRCYQNICKDFYFTGDLTGFSWSAKRRGVVRPDYSSFRRGDRTVVVQVAQIYSDGTILTKSYDVSRPNIVVSSKSSIKVSELALEKRNLRIR